MRQMKINLNKLVADISNLKSVEKSILVTGELFKRA